MGFLCTAMLKPKRTLQQLWESKVDWNEELVEDVKKEFVMWLEDLPALREVKIPRSFNGGTVTRESYQLHCYFDASQLAYAVIVFLRAEGEGNVTVQLIQAKTRLSPLSKKKERGTEVSKKVSILRLELLACTIGARLTQTVKEALNMHNIPTQYWSDSTTALAWIKRNDEWGTFVGNRVKEILGTSRAEEWRHVPGAHNPANLPSRGCSPSQLVDSKWWEGPEWLKSPREEWPCTDVSSDEETINIEKRKSAVSLMTTTTCPTPWYMKHYSPYIKNVKLVGWMQRFVTFVNKQAVHKGPLTIPELTRAEFTLFKLVQRETFPEEAEFISGLRVEKRNGLYQVKTKLLNRKDHEYFLYPILLPTSHPIVDQYIKYIHETNGHGGIQFLMGRIRERCWIIQGRRAVRQMVNKCIKCRRFSAKPHEAPKAALPEGRVKSARAFETTGIDLADPLFLKDSTKVWIVLFTCAVFRCVHLELVSTISTSDFIDALSRFVSRRGRPHTIYSDNGTNFVGAARAFKELDWKRIQESGGVSPINWKFNLPAAPWWGGWWERLVRVIKDLLKRMLGRSRVSAMQLQTYLCVVESVVNGRPLTFVTEDQEDLTPLTPAMFLQDMPITTFPEGNVGDAGLRAGFWSKQELREQLCDRFRKEYLSQLVQRGKEKKQQPIKVGDVVLVSIDNKKRQDWPLARITALIAGRDLKVRLAKVRIPRADLKSKPTELLRPVQRLYPLEMSSHALPVAENVVQDIKRELNKTTDVEDKGLLKVTSFGRRVKQPVKYGHWK